MREVPLSPHILRRRLDLADRERLIDRLAGVLVGESDVLFAYLFGSFLSEGAFADVDIAILLDPMHGSLRTLLDVQLDLMACLETKLHVPVDVVILNEAPLGLRLAAVQGRMIYSRNEAKRVEFVERTSLQAMDMEYFFRQSLQDLLWPRQARETRDSMVDG